MADAGGILGSGASGAAAGSAAGPWGALIGGVVGLVAGAIGAALADGEYDKAQKLREEFAAQYGDGALPQLDTVLAQKVDPTELGKIQEDPALRGQEVGVMGQLADIYQQGGMTAQDEAALQLANQGAAQRAASDYRSLEQDLARRGQSVGGPLSAALASQAGQDVVNATAQNRYRAQADARDRAFRALEASGSIAGRIRGEDYAKASQAAGAQDSINRFNATAERDAMNQNNANKRAAFADRMTLLAGRGAALGGVTSGIDASGNRISAAAGGIAKGANDLGSAYDAYNADGTPKTRKP